jgi:prevent-host-death family protein
MSRKREIAAGKFKAECLAVLDRVAATGETVVVTKRGKPVAEVVPVRRVAPRSLRGSVKAQGDLMGPVLGAWDVDA